MTKSETGALTFLNENVIQNKTCNLDEPFAFISYSHAPHDAIIIQNTFQMLTLMGYNLWIDVANIPYDQNSWQNAAFTALTSPNCKLAIFFRSEDSLTKEAIADEVEKIDANKNCSLITVDIWTALKMNSRMVYGNLKIDTENDPKNETLAGEFDACKRICAVVNPDNSAIRLMQDCNNDVGVLAKKLAEQMYRHSLRPAVRKDNPDDDRLFEEYAGIANEEIRRNTEYHRNNDFGVLAERLRKNLAPVQRVEDIFRDVAKVKDNKKALVRTLILRRDIAVRIALIAAVALIISGVIISTIKESLAYLVMQAHITSLSIIIGLFPTSPDPNVQLFVSVLVVSIVDALIITAVCILIPAIVKAIRIAIDNIRISSLVGKGERIMREEIERIPGFAQSYMCSFAMEFFISVQGARSAKNISDAMVLFNDYKATPRGIQGVAEVAPWLHDMRMSFENTWSQMKEAD